MKRKPLVCLIDQDPLVRDGWMMTLKGDADIDYFPDHLCLLNKASVSTAPLEHYSCIIMGRYYSHLHLDVVQSLVPETFRSSGAGPIFLNDQGYVSKEDLEQKFDGKLFHKYGVRWQTLRLRIQKYEKKHHTRHQGRPPAPGQMRVARDEEDSPGGVVTRPERCGALLRSMASRASGSHREKIEFYADRDPSNGIRLLEAIYDRLVTDKDRPETCPSRYINSSPVIAKRILRQALYSH